MKTRSYVQMVVQKKRLGDDDDDVDFWLAQPPQARIDALEEIRREYHQWKYGTEPRLQRVCRIIKRQ